MSCGHCITLFIVELAGSYIFFHYFIVKKLLFSTSPALYNFFQPGDLTKCQILLALVIPNSVPCQDWHGLSKNGCVTPGGECLSLSRQSIFAAEMWDPAFQGAKITVFEKV